MIKDLSKEQFIDVIKHGDDNLTNMLVVSNQGDVSLFPYEKHTSNTNPLDYGYAVVNGESFQPHNDYIGIGASEDEVFIRDEYKRMNKAWHKFLETGKQQQASDVYE